MRRILSVLLLVIAARAQLALAQVPAEMGPKLLQSVTPSLVAVHVTWEYEFGKYEFVGPGIVVSEDGLIMTTIGVVNPSIPDSQLAEFKIIIPRGDKDDEEIDAVFQGRDERSNLAFVRPKESRKWWPIKFEDLPINAGDPVVSVGMLPKGAGYKSYFQTAVVSTKLRGETPSYLVTGGALAAVGSPVFNLDGKAIGFVGLQADRQYLLHTSGGGRGGRGRRGGGGDSIDALSSITNPPNIFVPSSDFLFSVKDPPTVEKPLKLSWMGLPQLSGLEKDVAEVFGLIDQPAIEIGDVVPNSPADKAGLKTGMKIVKMNGQPLERGDEPEELPSILTRKLIRMAPGEIVTFSVLSEPNQPLQDIKVTLADRPKRSGQALRYFAEDLGFTAREMVFEDTYVRKLSPDAKGVVVAIIKPQSPAATAHLESNDVITQFNSQPVNDLEQFRRDYKSFRAEKPQEALVLVVMKPDASTQTIRIEAPRQ